ncbi:molecular chaperone [Pseudomonas sp. L13]|uniref:fimbrial biogenesis chaperone n=1 Tax=Pseudomonas sp. L13 TaxID=343985 RepID=UPI00137AD53D|nr:molecular chaperone [Pseudomonas sp. L13]NCE90669.1 molecular chaperone [Pseudomonas sp. L13]
MPQVLLKCAFGLVMAAHIAMVQAEIIIDRTRLIYPAAVRGVTLNLRNEADSPRLVQVWIDEGDPQTAPELSDVPFTVTPPILRMNPGKGHALRVIYHPVPRHTMADPQETVYWLNVLGIRPTDAASHHLQLAFRTRIKLFLRPNALPGRAEDAVAALQWQLADDRPVLRVRNPSAFHVTLSSVALNLEGVEYRHENPPMLAPRSTAELIMPGWVVPWRGTPTLRFTTLDDYGATHERTQRIGR